MKRYQVLDLQGGNFMSDTRGNPLTANQLRSRFWSLGDARTERYSEFTLAYITEMWHVRFMVAPKM